MPGGMYICRLPREVVLLNVGPGSVQVDFNFTKSKKLVGFRDCKVTLVSMVVCELFDFQKR